jgi:polyisoprenoid-binding protein YceI
MLEARLTEGELMDTTTDDRPDAGSGRGDGRRPGRIALLAAAAAAVVVVGLAIWWFLRDDAPAAVDLDTATAAVADEGDEAGARSEDGPSPDAEAETGGTEVDGDWTVDTSVGEFSFADSTGTYVGFRVAEELSGIGSTEAVGRTPEVSGAISIAGDTVTAVTIEADMAALTTDNSRRDGRVHDALDTADFPTAGFVLTEPIDLGRDPGSGEPVAATAIGDLTVHGVTNPVEVDLEAQLVGDTIVVVGSLDIVFADYGVTVPTAPIVLSAEDEGVVEFQLFLARA